MHILYRLIGNIVIWNNYEGLMANSQSVPRNVQKDLKMFHFDVNLGTVL